MCKGRLNTSIELAYARLFSPINIIARGPEIRVFFQEKDGIRVLTVTGVQTCALPIYFRVALRRLRSVLRSFRSELGDAVPKKLQRQLRDVTRATGAARDAEVQLGWVRSHRAELGRRLPPGLPWLLARVAQEQDEASADIRPTVPGEFRQLERRVRPGLSTTLLDESPAAPPFATATSRLIREHVAELEQEAEVARSGPDADAIHAARIPVKRLRYLLEPLPAERPRPVPTPESLKQLQTPPGDLPD